MLQYLGGWSHSNKTSDTLNADHANKTLEICQI